MHLSKSKLLSLLSAVTFTIASTNIAWAQTESDKTALKEQALELCQSAAEKRYGDNAIKSLGKKAKWSKGLNGAMVKMKIKPKSKKASKFQCVVSLDKSVKFYRG